MISVTLDGLPQTMQALERLVRQDEAAMIASLQANAEQILDDSFPLVPVDTGLLLSTGMVEQEHDGATVRYGGHGLAPYALVVHEDLTMNHPNGGQAKFLQQPFLAVVDRLPARVGQDIQARRRP